MSGKIIPFASITVPLLGKNLDAAGIVSHSEISSVLQSVIATFVSAIEQCQSEVTQM